MNHPNLNPLENLKNDFAPSIVVFLVAVPLCLGIALASGAPLISGLIAGMVGGIVVGLISESSLGVSGPAAGLAVIVYAGIQDLGSFPVFLSAVILSGLFQLVMGALRAGFIAYFFPSSVIKGMLAGIGCIIILKQIPHALGYDKVYEGSLSFIQEDGQNTLSELLNVLDFISPGPVLISLVSLGVLILWETNWIKRYNWIASIPAPLISVILGSFLYVSFEGIEGFNLNQEQVVNVPVLGSFSEISTLVTLPDLSAMFRLDVIKLGLTIAVIGSIETLLCLEATDKLDPYKRVTSTNRELYAQGVGNVISGLVGGLPVTQVIVRSSSNIQAKAKTKASAILHGVWLLISVAIFPTLLNFIPLSSLAAILLAVGYKLIKPEQFVKLYNQGSEQFVPFIVTVLALVFTDLLIGVSLGLAVGLFSILWSNYLHPYYADPDLEHPEDGVRIQLAEDVSFLNKAGLIRTLDHFPDGLRVVIDASRTRKMHPDIQEIIDAFLINAKTRDIDVEYLKRDKSKVENHHETLVEISREKSEKGNLKYRQGAAK